jgi:hypothetical protein
VSSKLNYGTSFLIACHFIRNISVRSVSIHTDLHKTVLFLLLRVGLLSDELVIIETERANAQS